MTEKGLQVEELIENRYRVLDVIGKGGMGTLYRVADEASGGQIVALKTVRLDVSAEETAKRMERFQREFQLLTQLRHPNLVSVFDFGITGEGELYFTMEWIEGQDLEPGRRPLEPEATTPVIVQICRALAYLHARGVIHGDLKPANVLLVAGANEQVKIVDFGVAHEIRSPEVIGQYYTPGYSAPEMREQDRVDQRADLYSLGAMWYALLVGEPPTFMFGAERLARLSLAEILGAQDRIPAEVGDIITRLLAESAEERYTSANEVIEAVNKVTGSTYELETRETAASYALRTRFVNREVEIEVLEAVWKEVQESEGKVVLISGESGVGKTRLAVELEVQAELEGARVVWGQCVERGGDAYHSWREVLRVLVRYVEDADETAMRQVGPVLATLLPELWERHYMANVAPPAELEPQAAQLRLNDAIAQTLQKAAGLRPTVVMIENVHWADEATLEMLQFLARIPGAAALLVCVTYRDDEVDSEHVLETLEGKRVQRVRVHRLSPKVTADLVCSMLGLERLPTLLTERVQQTTGGNAFFVQELIRSLAAEGEVLRRTVEGWQVNGEALREVQLPESIQQVVERRLVQLSENARRVLEWAAAVGLVFWEEAVVEAGQMMRAKVRAALAELSDLELIARRDETSFVGEREYLFPNPTVRETSYESIPLDRRRACHSRVAAWLMAHSDEAADEHLGLTGDHLEKAGQTEQAIAYLRRAGEQAVAQFANAEAIAYFSRALDLTSQNDLDERYTLLLAREEIYHLQGDREPQAQDLKVLKRLAEALGDDQRKIRVALRRARCGEATSDYSAAVAAARAAVALAQSAQDTGSEAEGHLVWGMILWRQGNHKASRARFEQALATARKVGARYVEADCLRYLGVISIEQGEYTEARAYYEQTLHTFREIGDRRRECRVLNLLGEGFRHQGDDVAAEHYYQQALNLACEIGYRRGEGIALCNLGLLAHRLGRDEDAREYSQRTLVITQEIGGRSFQGFALTNLGHALAGLGCRAEAVESYQQALDIRRSLGQHSLVMETLAGLARLCLTQDDLPQAQVCVEEILELLENNSLEGADEPFLVYLTCYRVLRASQDPRAQDILNTAHTLLQEQATKITDQDICCSFLENVPAHREIVREYEKAAG
jgi:predicted ATPase